jgi:hypothetical protein
MLAKNAGYLKCKSLKGTEVNLKSIAAGSRNK